MKGRGALGYLPERREQWLTAMGVSWLGCIWLRRRGRARTSSQITFDGPFFCLSIADRPFSRDLVWGRGERGTGNVLLLLLLPRNALTLTRY